MNKKILIIDDEADIRFLLKRALISFNFRVEEAENLKQGKEVYSRLSPDITILDVNLPDGNGIEHAEYFKNEDNIVLLISADNDQLTDVFKDVGANGFLRKPFGISELLAAIKNVEENNQVIRKK